MAASNINVVVIDGNLTRDPELRHTGSGTPVCDLRVAVNGRRQNQAGAWVDKVNYFDVVVWGTRATNCAEYLAKGKKVAVEGRLDWQEWEAKDGSGKRQAVKIKANHVEFLSPKPNSPGTEESGASHEVAAEAPAEEEVHTDSAAAEDDIPF